RRSASTSRDCPRPCPALPGAVPARLPALTAAGGSGNPTSCPPRHRVPPPGRQRALRRRPRFQLIFSAIPGIMISISGRRRSYMSLNLLRAAQAVAAGTADAGLPSDRLRFTLEYTAEPDLAAERARLAALLGGENFALEPLDELLPR